jgi:outer membrane protein assembly factor BamB
MSTPHPPSSTPASGRWPLYVAVLFLLLFAGLVVHQLQARRVRLSVNVDLLKELDEAEFLEDKAPAGNRANEWPQWRGPRRDGVAWTSHLLTKWSEKDPQQLWEVPGGESYASSAVVELPLPNEKVELRLYTMQYEKDQESILCRRADTGKEIWRMGYERSPLKVEYGNFPRATPTVDGGQVFTLGPTGRLQCRGAENGDLVWERDLLKDYQGRLPRWGYSSSPLVLGETVFVNPGGPDGNSIVALGRKTGKGKNGKEELWKALDDPAGYSSPIAITLDKTEQVVFFTPEGLVGLSADEGELLWRFPWVTDFQVSAATPLAFKASSGKQVHQYVFITSGYKKGCALVRVDGNKKDGFQAREVFTSNEMACHFSSPVRCKDHVYGFDEDKLTCMSLRTGEVCWKQRGYQKGALLLAETPAGPYLVVVGEAGQLALLQAVPKPEQTGPSPTARARPPEARKCWAGPVLAAGLLYIRDEKHLICLKLSGEAPKKTP